MLLLVLVLWTTGARAQINAEPDHDPWPVIFDSNLVSESTPESIPELIQLAPLSGTSFNYSASAGDPASTVEATEQSATSAHTTSAPACADAACSAGHIVSAAGAALAARTRKAQGAFRLHLPYAPVARMVVPAPDLNFKLLEMKLPSAQTVLLILSILFWPASAGLLILVGYWCWQRWFKYERKLVRAARAGLARGEFHIEYQPLMSIRGRACVGMDALLRWANPDFGKIGSANYMAIIEQCNWIVVLMKFALARVAQEIGELSEARPLYVIVDIPVTCFSNEGFLRKLIEVVAKDDTHRIVIGLNHETVIDMEGTLVSQMAYARAKGVIFALTGMGADEGNGAFRYPKELSFEIVKVDRRIFELEPPLRAHRLQLLASGAREMDAMLIVDGVDTGVHHDVLRAVGGEFGQGFFYSRPLAMRRLKSFLQGSARARFL
jgi:EAL domain-containing protein (putative c-di-GMP-specific phosphodiesterase class I)